MVEIQKTKIEIMETLTYNGIDKLTSMKIECRKHFKTYLVNICRTFNGRYNETLLQFTTEKEAMKLFNDLMEGDKLLWGK